MDIVIIAILHGPPERTRTSTSYFELALDVCFMGVGFRNRNDSLRPLSGQYERQFDATTYGKIPLLPYVRLGQISKLI